MKQILASLFIAFGVFTQAYAQMPEPQGSTEFEFPFGEWTAEQKNKPAYIFADVCNVRSAPDAQAAVSGKLAIGTQVEVLDVTTAKFTQNGLACPWVKIKSGTVTGYVWGGLLTNGILKLPDGKLVLWGLVSMKMDDGAEHYTASVRLAEKGTVLDKHDVSLEYASRPKDGYLIYYAAPKITGIKNVITFETLSEACGVTATSHYFMYTGGKLVYVGSGYSMGDGGVLYTTFEYRFPYPQPENSGYDYHYTPNENHILRVQSEGGYDDDC